MRWVWLNKLFSRWLVEGNRPRDDISLDNVDPIVDEEEDPLGDHNEGNAAETFAATTTNDTSQTDSISIHNDHPASNAEQSSSANNQKDSQNDNQNDNQEAPVSENIAKEPSSSLI
jgi:hypothetical protein